MHNKDSCWYKLYALRKDEFMNVTIVYELFKSKRRQSVLDYRKNYTDEFDSYFMIERKVLIKETAL